MPWTDEARRKAGQRHVELLKDPNYAAIARAKGKAMAERVATDPAVAAKWRTNHRASMQRLYSDPDGRARMGCLPPMTEEERRLYRKLTTNGTTRAAALKVMGKE